MAQRALTARVVVCAVTMLAAVLPSHVAGAQEELSPTVTLDRAEGLSRVDLVTVTASGFQPSESVGIEQCAVAGGGAPRCQASTARPTWADDAGALLESFVVTAEVTTTAGDAVDCRVAAGACVVIVTGASGEASSPIPLDFVAASPPRGRYLDEVFSDVAVTKDIPYGEAIDVHGNRVVLTLDLYQPAGDDAAERPVVMWIHGGGFQRGSKETYAVHSEAFARRGYVAVAINYRLGAQGLGANIARAYEDATAAVAWLRRNASSYRLDPDAIAAGGGSAGAVTALNLAYAPEFVSGQQSQIAAAISLNGVTTFGRAEPAEPPSIFFHGTEDAVVPYEPAVEACDAIRAVGVRCDFVTYLGVPHGLGSASSPFRPHIFETTAQFLFEVLPGVRGGPPAVPTSKADCKNGGWRSSISDRGQPFRNQGRCVSFVARRR